MFGISRPMQFLFLDVLFLLLDVLHYVGNLNPSSNLNPNPNPNLNP